MTMEELLTITCQHQASDLHLVVGSPPLLRINGELIPAGDYAPLKAEETKLLIFTMLNDQQKELLLANKEIDLSFQFGDAGRFRINAYYEKGAMAAALRLIPNHQELLMSCICHRYISNLPISNKDYFGNRAYGSWKVFYSGSYHRRINETRTAHIVTIEDPIEYVHSPVKSVISQREMHGDTHSWQVALRSVLREDPDVVLVGEMRDYETISAALTVAETGHLVLATLHTNSASQTIDRVIDVFPEHQQAQIRMQLSNALEAVVAQRLLPAVKGGRLPATEILLATAAVKTLSAKARRTNWIM
jgi:twitching motility protein PilT